MACAPYGKLNGMQETNICLFCDICFRVVYLTSFVHTQFRWTPFLRATSNGQVEIAVLLMEKGANIEATDEVQFVAMYISYLFMDGCNVKW